MIFFAYAARPNEIVDTIHRGVDRARNGNNPPEIELWEDTNVSGRLVPIEVLDSISNCSSLVADITGLNFNVTYEVGYAIGMGKRVNCIVYKAVNRDEQQVKRVGIFDTLGHKQYANSLDLSVILRELGETNPIPLKVDINFHQPVFVLETPEKTDPMLAILNRVKKERMAYRSFDPAEQSRMSASETIDDVAASVGVIVPLLEDTMKGCDVHNIRGAFVAGLAHGMKKATLMLKSYNAEAEVDVRDIIREYRHPDDIKKFVAEFQPEIFEGLQSFELSAPKIIAELAQIQVGSSKAENEFRDLSRYFVPTDVFQRMMRSEVDLIIGRKGSGKTALFGQVRDSLRAKRSNVILDLKPEGFQLLKLKDRVIRYLAEGSKAHLLTAFWEYLLLLEICRKLIEKDAEVHKRDHRLFEPFQKLLAQYESHFGFREADFSERLDYLATSVGGRFVDAVDNLKQKSTVELGSDQLTNIIYAQDIRKLRSSLEGYLVFKDEVRVLFDNLDKGWNATGISAEDLLIVRTLIDATKKMERYFQRRELSFKGHLFLRNDVYQLVMASTSDHGKEEKADIDWRDEKLLRELLYRRLQDNPVFSDMNMKDIWSNIAVRRVLGQDSLEFLLQHSLMRPRFLINLFNYCKSSAANLGKERIEEDDFLSGLRTFSNDLIIDISLELEDICEGQGEFLYQFVDSNARLSVAELREMAENSLLTVDQILDQLIWQGFLGVRHRDADSSVYIFDAGYNPKILRAHIEKWDESDRCLIVHPSFRPGLVLNSDGLHDT